MKALYCREINQRWADLAASAKWVAIASYNTHSESARDYLWCDNTRLIIGVASTGERSATMGSIVYTVAHRYPHVRVRKLIDSHAKIFVAHGARKMVAIVGSQNLGSGHPYELAIEVGGKAAEAVYAHFETMWNLAVPIKALDYHRIADRLRSSEFEVKRET